MENKFLEKFRGKKWIEYIFLGVLSIIVIVIFSTSLFSSKGTKGKIDEDTASIYISNLETRLSDVLSSVKGAGKVTVTITSKGGIETVLATEVIKTTDANNKTIVTETPILVNGKTVVLMEKYPEIIGVLIVAQGAESFTVMNKLQQATVSLLNIELSKVEILTMK